MLNIFNISILFDIFVITQLIELPNHIHSDFPHSWYIQF